MRQYRAVALQPKDHPANFASRDASPIVLPEYAFTGFPREISFDSGRIFLEAFCSPPEQRLPT